MNFLQEIEDEIQQAANEMTAEVIIMLMDKLDKDFAQKVARNRVSMSDRLHHYTGMKIALHHLIRRYWDDEPWLHAASSTYVDKKVIYDLKIKVRNARRDYYVAKREYEGKHEHGCTCRGCRCIGSFAENGTGAIG